MRTKSWLAGIGSLYILASGLPAIAQSGAAHTCIEPTTQQQSDVAAYLAKKNHLTSVADLNLVKSEKADDACFWKFEYEGPQKKQIIAYLSPDRTFLTSDLYDLRIDPLLEDRKKEESVMAEMLTGDPPLMGPAGAPVSVVEFSDFECPYCLKLKAILEQDVLPKTGGKISIAFRNFPLPMHPWAKPAAMMAACAGLQNTPDFWKVHDFLFDNQKSLTPDNLRRRTTAFVASDTILDKAQFEKCIDKDLALGMVTKDVALGTQNGVRATPTVFVNGIRYEGVQSAVQLLAIINSAANGSSTSPAGMAGANAPNECVKPSSR